MHPGRWLRWFSPSSHLVPWWHWAWASLCQKLPWWQLCFWLSCRLGEATCIGYVGSLSGTLCKNQGARFLTRRYTERTSFIFLGGSICVTVNRTIPKVFHFLHPPARHAARDIRDGKSDRWPASTCWWQQSHQRRWKNMSHGSNSRGASTICTWRL